MQKANRSFTFKFRAKNMTKLRLITCLEKFQWLVLIYLETEGSPNSPPALLIQLECVASVQDQHPSWTFCNRTLVLKIIFSELHDSMRSIRDAAKSVSQGARWVKLGVCCGSGMFIPDPNFSIRDPRSRVKKIPDRDPHQKNYLGCSSRIQIHPEVNKTPDPGSALLQDSIIVQN